MAIALSSVGVVQQRPFIDMDAVLRIDQAGRRFDRVQDRAEQIQAKSAQLVSGSRKAMLVILPVILVLIVYVSWLFFHYVSR